MMELVAHITFTIVANCDNEKELEKALHKMDYAFTLSRNSLVEITSEEITDIVIEDPND